MKINVEISRQENADWFSCKVGDTVSVDFEEYVAGVTASELASGGTEACRAQAIAARTFAVARGVLNGTPISDAASKAQAYRAPRASLEKYPVPYRAAMDTAGLVLTWNGKPANTVYCSSNGGETVSSEEKWGGVRPYLIHRADLWDAAVTSGRSGHGVGMSQVGARYAGVVLGKKYPEILAFYYPGCVITKGYGLAEEGVKPAMFTNEKSERILKLLESLLGCPYVFGAIGEECTPQQRGRRQSAKYPTIKSKCQVLMGRASSCDGCRFQGKQMFDCRGLTYWCLKQEGITISTVGATTQWNTARDWRVRGEIADLPEGLCVVFSKNGTKMSHTGFYIGNGYVIEAAEDVVKTPIDRPSGCTKWTHYAIPVGLYNDAEYKQLVEVKRMRTTLRRGASGELVRECQEMLVSLGYAPGTVDGKYGDRTIAAVAAFQKDHRLTADGICGPLTWAAVDEALADKEKETLYRVDISGVTWEQYLRILEICPLARVEKE